MAVSIMQHAILRLLGFLPPKIMKSLKRSESEDWFGPIVCPKASFALN